MFRLFTASEIILPGCMLHLISYPVNVHCIWYHTPWVCSGSQVLLSEGALFLISHQVCTTSQFPLSEWVLYLGQCSLSMNCIWYHILLLCTAFDIIYSHHALHQKNPPHCTASDIFTLPRTVPETNSFHGALLLLSSHDALRLMSPPLMMHCSCHHLPHPIMRWVQAHGAYLCLLCRPCWLLSQWAPSLPMELCQVGGISDEQNKGDAVRGRNWVGVHNTAGCRRNVCGGVGDYLPDAGALHQSDKIKA